MLSYISQSIHKALVGLVHLWVAHHCLDRSSEGPATEATFWVDAHMMGWGQHVLPGKRVKVTFTVEDTP
jgi:hypothetical protein